MGSKLKKWRKGIDSVDIYPSPPRLGKLYDPLSNYHVINTLNRIAARHGLLVWHTHCKKMRRWYCYCSVRNNLGPRSRRSICFNTHNMKFGHLPRCSTQTSCVTHPLEKEERWRFCCYCVTSWSRNSDSFIYLLQDTQHKNVKIEGDKMYQKVRPVKTCQLSQEVQEERHIQS